MIQPIDIIAITGRSPEGDGVSRPFHCLDSEKRAFYVKLKNVGYQHLVKEWICGRLAQEMGLDCANIYQANIPLPLIAKNSEYERDLGSGVAFASQKVEGCITLEEHHLVQTATHDSSHHLLDQILMFDWWVKNSDRSLGKIGGNPNLLWSISKQKVVMIDHDNAFDEAFSAENFREHHALRNFKNAWQPASRLSTEQWLKEGLGHLDSIWQELPQSWLFDSFGDARTSLSKEELKETLSLPWTQPDLFWSTP